jgi:hypothetical protein
VSVMAIPRWPRRCWWCSDAEPGAIGSGAPKPLNGLGLAQQEVRRAVRTHPHWEYYLESITYDRFALPRIHATRNGASPVEPCPGLLAMHGSSTGHTSRPALIQ